MHVARAMVALGAVDSTQEAFDRYLGRGCVGHVPQQWPGVDAAIAAIRAAGGHAVLAHPHRYKLSGGALRNLCAEFAAWGGSALEVSLPGLSPGGRESTGITGPAARAGRLRGLGFSRAGAAVAPTGSLR